MNYLSLFTGAGGGDLAMQHLLGFKCVGYVEYEPYCQKLIRQRIADGFLDAAPIFGDIRNFISEGYAESYQGMVDLVTGGFPCQPFSVAGKQLGADDPRNMWPQTISSIRIIRPRYAFLENVPGLLASGYFGTILRDIHESGFNARWALFSSQEGRLKQLDEKGRCCGKKPLVYSSKWTTRDGPHKFCGRCDRAYSLKTGEQIENWAWKKIDGEFVRVKG